ncbi:MAG TPA: molybdopterin-dependent oxidoreductase, partial [Ktedonobacterales bacterium]|nr:molybdopterin-dependent oxidoreductase [Ktedonobacterales bacterium]
STAEWTGVQLQTVLDRAGVPHPQGKRVAFYSVDGYSTSLPLEDVLAARALLAWEMNGEPLPDRHGYPLRLIMPGRYGEQSTKWLTRIEIIDYHYKGFYESQGWNPGPVSTTSRIDFPQMGRVSLGGVSDTTVRGIAYSGIRGIRRVEVSADNGQTWSDATLQPPLSDQSWVFWRWKPLVPGTYTLVVRATDGTGAVQTAQQRGTVPQGSTGWHIVPVTVVA